MQLSDKYLDCEADVWFVIRAGPAGCLSQGVRAGDPANYFLSRYKYF